MLHHVGFGSSLASKPLCSALSTSHSYHHAPRTHAEAILMATMDIKTKASIAKAAAAAKMRQQTSGMSILAITSIATNVVATFIFFVLFCWTAASDIFDAEAKDDGNDSWWDMDLVHYERSALKLVLNEAVLMVSTGFLLVLKVKTYTNTKLYDRFNLGVLAASTFCVANMLFISFWYCINFGEDEENENENENDDEDDGKDWMDTLTHSRTVIASISCIFAIIFFVISVLIFREARMLPEINVHAGVEPARAQAHMEILGELWTLLSASTVTIFLVLLIAASVLNGQQQGDKKKETGYGANLIAVLVWLIVVSAFVSVLGRKILGATKKNGTQGVGMLSGGVLYFALLLFMVFILYANSPYNERNKDDGLGAATALGFAGFFLSLLYIFFFTATYKYKTSMFAVLPQNSGASVVSESTAGDFKRMEEDPQVEMASGSYTEASAASAEQGVV